jgi:hypothetical protein
MSTTAITRVKELEASTGGNLNQIAELKVKVDTCKRQIEEKNTAITACEKKLAEAITARDGNAERIGGSWRPKLATCKIKWEELNDKARPEEQDDHAVRERRGSQAGVSISGRSPWSRASWRPSGGQGRLMREREEAIAAQFEAMKATWLNHERRVEEVLRALCMKHAIEYLGKEKVPFKGKPTHPEDPRGVRDLRRKSPRETI